MNAASSHSPSPTRLPLSAAAGINSPSSPPQADLQCVYGRTFEGHREALRTGDSLSPAERRLLLLVTGLTPLDVLTPQTSGIADPVATADKLLQAGLIEPIVPKQMGVSTWPPRQSKWWS